ncbi:MAG: hypothetical protein DCF17_05235 [Shackletoniella antarctica]|jgi:AraC-like DNA-binding protein|uniref:HTH araC/xylS-type domain-containing protein n=1 Tax=Shackletoniella antarctica TaxID=268115 RepID=A0A2W4WHB8_9CYAN|nr:MAG: hypothetical protein DCF17_05235 [Shackletoniella antarctica]
MSDIPSHEMVPGRQFHIFPLEGYSGNTFPHKHNFYEIIWPWQGDGIHLIDFQEHSLDSHAVFLLKPDQVNKFASKNLAGYIIEFSEPFLCHEPQDRVVLEKLCQSNHFQLNSSVESAVRKLLALLYQEYLSEDSRSDLIRTYLKAIIINLSKVLKSADLAIYDGDTERIAHINKLLRENFKTHKNVKFYANSLSLTPKRLNEILKLKTGKTMTELIHNRLEMEARRELIFGQLSVKDIALKLGFDDPSYFSRFFLRTAGMYPQDYRKNNHFSVTNQ